MDHKEVLYIIYISILKLFTAKQRFQKIKVFFDFLIQICCIAENSLATSHDFTSFLIIIVGHSNQQLLKQRYARNSPFTEKEIENKEEEIIFPLS